MAVVIRFDLYLLYEDESDFRPICRFADRQQLLDVLSRHINLAMVSEFRVVPYEVTDAFPFEEFTL